MEEEVDRSDYQDYWDAYSQIGDRGKISERGITCFIRSISQQGIINTLKDYQQKYLY